MFPSPRRGVRGEAKYGTTGCKDAVERYSYQGGYYDAAGG